jgi:CHAT domain-containing protein/tetratricopeptide (TPR) repeat protein
MSAWLVVLAAATASSQSADEVSPRLELVRDRLEAGRYVEAEAEAERLLLAARNSSDRAGLEANAMDLLVEALVLNGRAAGMRARELAELAVQTRGRGGSVEPSSLATSLRNLGDVLFQAGDFQLAAARYREALALIERSPDPATSDVGEILDRLARTLTEAGRYDEALELANRAVALREQSPDRTGVGIARTLQVRGRLVQLKAEYARALPDFQRAVALHEAVHSQHPETAAALTFLGAALFDMGDLLQARDVLTRAVSMAEATLRREHPDIAWSARKLAAALMSLGDLAGARSMGERALMIDERAFGFDHPRVADQLNDLANTLLVQGEYSAARLLYERSLNITEKRYGSDHFAVGTTVYNLANLLGSLGDLSEARRQFQRAIQIWTRAMGPEHPSIATALSTLAGTLADEGLHQEARTYLERALVIRERAVGPDHPLVASTLEELSVSLAMLGFGRRSSELSARSLRIREEIGAPRGLAGSLEVHARLLAQQGDYRGARQSYQRALEIRRPLFLNAHPTIARTEVALAAVEAHLGDWDDALARALRGEAIGRDHLRLTLGSLAERQALDFAATRPRGLELALSLPPNPQASAPMLDALIRGRALILDEVAARRQALAGADSQLAALWTGLASARQRLANLVVRGPSDQRPGQYATLIEDARREKELAERRLAEQSAAFQAELTKADIGLEQVRASLLSGSAMVSYVRYDRTVFRAPPAGAALVPSAPPSPARAPRTVPSYAALVLRSDGTDPTIVPLGPADRIERLVATWRRMMLEDVVRPRGAPPLEPPFRSVAVSLRRAIWDPVARHLADVSRVFVIPDGAINLVPLAALPSAATRYLVEDGPVIHYLSAERDLVTNAGQKAPSRAGLLAVGGPAFADGSSFSALAGAAKSSRAGPTMASNEASSTARSSAPASSQSGSRPAYRGRPPQCYSFQSMEFPPLPGTRQEAETVAGLWRQPATEPEARATTLKMLLGHDATERAFKELAPGQSVLHIGTHGFFLADDCTAAPAGTRAVGGLTTAPSSSAAKRPPAAPAATSRATRLPENPLVLSGLAFAGANRRAAAGQDEDDGILTGEEVAALNLEGVEWAVLSACNTGLGEVRAGEGVLGLRRAFQTAGVRTVIMSLWSVEDRATSAWMRALYERRLVEGLDTAEAVHEASLTVLRERRARGQSAHPFYWAAFVAAGDWQ